MSRHTADEAGRLPACWFRSPTPETTHAAAEALGRLALANSSAQRRPRVLLLCGPLGAGKTLFAQGLAAGLGVPPGAVASPTFTLLAEYPLSGGGRLLHADCYRLQGVEELEALGVADWLDAGSIVAVEWGDRFPDAFPADRLQLTLARTPEVGQDSAVAQARMLRAGAGGPDSAAWLRGWSECLPDIEGLRDLRQGPELQEA